MDDADRPIRWGIAGTGDIATAMAGDLALVPGARLQAIGSRAGERAEAFAAAHGAARAYGSYAALIADPDIDVLYVATPHPQHHPIALAALAAGKAVLVEKAFTATLAGTREVVAAARRAKRFAMEAMWTRFQPAVVRARELIAAGAVGTPLDVQADLGVARPFDPAHRLWAPELAGGALLDLGTYAVSLAQMVLGTPTSVAAVGRDAPNGVEAAATLLLGFDGGRSATATLALDAQLPSAARIVGDEGWLELAAPFHHPGRLLVHRAGEPAEAFDLPPRGRGYAHEVEEVHRCLRADALESSVMPLDDTLTVMAVLEEAGRQLGRHWQEAPRLPS